MAGAAICLGFLTGHWPILGIPGTWPPASMQELFVIAAAGGLFDLAPEISNMPRRVTWPDAAMIPASAPAWLGWPWLLRRDRSDGVILLSVAVAGATGLLNLHARRWEPRGGY